MKTYKSFYPSLDTVSSAGIYATELQLEMTFVFCLLKLFENNITVLVTQATRV